MELGQNNTAYSSCILIFLIKKNLSYMICIESKIQVNTDDKDNYFIIGGANKTHDERRQHQNTSFLLGHVLYATKWLCKNYTFYITKRSKHYICVASCVCGRAGILVVEKKFCDCCLKTR